MKTIYFDCYCGASGDMIVGALLDCGADFEAIKRALATLKVQGFAVRADKVNKKGIMATQFHVDVDPSEKQPHRHLRHCVEIINEGDLPEPVKIAACETFRRIAVAEAAVHGTTIEKVHFHEVGAIDSIVDIVAAHLALHQLGIERVLASHVHVGAGTVKCAHGIMPVPAPATALLLEGVPSYGGDVQAELTTPTGAALLAQLAERFGPQPVMAVNIVGYGSGRRDLEDRANVLRALVGQTQELPETEPIVVIEANMDDLAPEFYPPLMQDVLRAGARDVFVTPIVGKKGRPGHLLTVLCEEQRVPELTPLIFRDTTTLGFRMRVEQRVCLHRTWKNVETPWGTVRVKIGSLNGGVTNAAPEFEDCRERAEAASVSVLAVYTSASAAAAKGEWSDA